MLWTEAFISVSVEQLLTTKVRKRKRLVCGSILNENVKSNGSFIGRQLGSSHVPETTDCDP